MTEVHLNNSTLEESTGLNWEIVAITDADDETKELYLDRNRKGAIVRPLNPLIKGYQLVLQYVEGERAGKYLQHSIIQKHVFEGETLKVYTRNTVYVLKPLNTREPY